MTIAAAALNTIALFDSPDAINSGHTILLEVFVVIAGLALLTQAIVVVVFAFGAYKAQKRLVEIGEELRGKALPFIENTHSLVTDLTPRIKDITANVQHISFVVRDKITEFEPTVSAVNVTVKDANQKTHEQIARVNGMITSALNATAELGAILQDGIRKPAKEVSGIINGIKAGVESLIHKTRGFGAGFTPNPARQAPTRSSYPIPPTYTAEPTYPQQPTRPSTYPTTPQSSAAAATKAFNQAEKTDLGL